MKTILVVCQQTHIDVPLRRSLAHLVKSCDIEVVPDGYQAFATLSTKAFDLIIIDSDLDGLDSLELVESINYIDPGVPTLLMLHPAHRSLQTPARHLQARPILRPFKPLAFLRAVDKLLHQQLERYRELGEALTLILDSLTHQSGAAAAFLFDETGQPLVTSGQLEPATLSQLASLAISHLSSDHSPQPEPGPEAEPPDHKLYLIELIEHLYLATILPVPAPPQPWLKIRLTAEAIRRSFYDKASRPDPALLAEEDEAEPPHQPDPVRLMLPLQLNHSQPEPDLTSSFPQSAAEESAVNWSFISPQKGLSTRLHDFCQLG